MNWKRKLQSKSRSPDFLWRMSLGILAAGLLAGFFLESSLSGQSSRWTDFVAHRSLVEKLDAQAADGQWSKVWWGIPELMKRNASHGGPVGLALVTGICWFIFVLQSLKVQGWADPRLWLAIVAVLLGILSIWPTLFFIFWQEFGWGLKESQSLIGGLRYNILGIGLREEFAKLLCVLPLMPFLLRMKSELAALLICGCVGLGFAVEENIGYFVRESGTSVVGRYITANPFHMTMTGLVGLAVYRGLRSPRDWGPHILSTFGLMVFAHGLYDAFGTIPLLMDYSLFGFIIFALVVYQFFRELRELRPEVATRSVSPRISCAAFPSLLRRPLCFLVQRLIGTSRLIPWCRRCWVRP